MEEPDLSLLEHRPSYLVPILLVVTLCVLSILALVLSPPRKPRKLPREAPPPKVAAPPLYVTVVPVTEDGWCCKGGQLSAATRARCTTAQGAFFSDETEGKKGCPATAATAKSGSPRGRGTGT
jgi:hypothetical protein